MMVSLASQISLLQGEEGAEGSKGGASGPEPSGTRPAFPRPYLTWLELNTVIPATNTRSPAAAAMPSRNVYQPSQAKYSAAFSPKYHLRGTARTTGCWAPRDAHSATGCSRHQGMLTAQRVRVQEWRCLCLGLGMGRVSPAEKELQDAAFPEDFSKEKSWGSPGVLFFPFCFLFRSPPL